MNASKPLLPNMNVQTEYEELEGLRRECEIFLNRWGAYEVYGSDTPTDAIVAVFRAQQEIVARRSYILGLLHQKDIPF